MCENSKNIARCSVIPHNSSEDNETELSVAQSNVVAHNAPRANDVDTDYIVGCSHMIYYRSSCLVRKTDAIVKITYRAVSHRDASTGGFSIVRNPRAWLLATEAGDWKTGEINGDEIGRDHQAIE